MSMFYSSFGEVSDKACRVAGGHFSIAAESNFTERFCSVRGWGTECRGRGPHPSALAKWASSRQGETCAGVEKCCGATRVEPLR